jgi:hypothetical protein
MSKLENNTTILKDILNTISNFPEANTQLKKGIPSTED